MSLPPGFLDELRGRVSLAQIVGRKVAWDRKSNATRGDYWAPCPFHQEKSASFHVDDAKGYYYCFGCHAKGDAVSFLRETENLGFLDAVERLAGIAGMPVPARDPAAAARSVAQTGLVEAMEAAVQFYRLQLKTGRATEARAYLDRRGLAAATSERFEIGYAPDSRTALIEHLAGKGFATERLIEAGLVGRPEGGGTPYDRFRGRIMFPIRDARGRAIAFGARALSDGQQPKYLNSPETPLFDKGRSLYNIGPARAAAAKTGGLLLVEGYMDVIALAQAGFEHAVAPLGTAVTEEQLALAWKIAPEPTVALDGDAAGLRAGQRVVDLALPLLAAGKSLRFAILPAGQDPDDVLRAGGARALEPVLATTRSMLDLLWERETSGAPLDSPERRAALDARLRAHLGRITDPSLRAHYEADIRARRQTLFAETWRPATAPRRGARQTPRQGRARLTEGAPVASTRASPLAQPAHDPTAEARIREGAILLACLNHPTLAAACEERLERVEFVCADLAEIRDALLSTLGATPHARDGAHPLADRVAEQVGRDILAQLGAIGQLSANPHLKAGADPDMAALVIEEELTRHAALASLRAEAMDAGSELARPSGDRSPDWIAPRLRQAADAAHESFILSGDNDDLGEERSEFADTMASIEAQQSAKTPRKR